MGSEDFASQHINPAEDGQQDGILSSLPMQNSASAEPVQQNHQAPQIDLNSQPLKVALINISGFHANLLSYAFLEQSQFGIPVEMHVYSDEAKLMADTHPPSVVIIGNSRATAPLSSVIKEEIPIIGIVSTSGAADGFRDAYGDAVAGIFVVPARMPLPMPGITGILNTVAFSRNSRAEAKRQALLKAEEERRAAERAEAERLAAEEARLAAEQAEKERQAAEEKRRAEEQAEAERLAAQQEELEQQAKEQQAKQQSEDIALPASEQSGPEQLEAPVSDNQRQPDEEPVVQLPSDQLAPEQAINENTDVTQAASLPSSSSDISSSDIFIDQYEREGQIILDALHAMLSSPPKQFEENTQEDPPAEIDGNILEVPPVAEQPNILLENLEYPPAIGQPESILENVVASPPIALPEELPEDMEHPPVIEQAEAIPEGPEVFPVTDPHQIALESLETSPTIVLPVVQPENQEAPDLITQTLPSNNMPNILPEDNEQSKFEAAKTEGVLSEAHEGSGVEEVLQVLDAGMSQAEDQAAPQPADFEEQTTMEEHIDVSSSLPETLPNLAAIPPDWINPANQVDEETISSPQNEETTPFPLEESYDTFQLSHFENISHILPQDTVKYIPDNLPVDNEQTKPGREDAAPPSISEQPADEEETTQLFSTDIMQSGELELPQPANAEEQTAPVLPEIQRDTLESQEMVDTQLPPGTMTSEPDIETQDVQAEAQSLVSATYYCAAHAPESGIIAVLGSGNGCGVTTIATSLATALAAYAPTGLVDLDQHVGAIATLLALNPSENVVSVAKAIYKQDQDSQWMLVKGALQYPFLNTPPSLPQLAVLAGPAAYDDHDRLRITIVHRLLEILKQHFTYVVLDLGSTFTFKMELPKETYYFTHPGIDLASRVIISSTPNLLGAVNLARVAHTLTETMSIPLEKIDLLLNKVPPKESLAFSKDEIQQQVGVPIEICLPFEHESALTSELHRTALVREAPESGFAQAMRVYVEPNDMAGNSQESQKLGLYGWNR